MSYLGAAGLEVLATHDGVLVGIGSTQARMHVSHSPPGSGHTNEAIHEQLLEQWFTRTNA